MLIITSLCFKIIVTEKSGDKSQSKMLLKISATVSVMMFLSNVFT